MINSTKVYPSAEDYLPPAGANYIFGCALEDRVGHVDALFQRVELVPVKIFESSDFQFRFRRQNFEETVSTRSSKQLESFCKNLSNTLIFLDITGLPHHTWAPILKAFVSNGVRFRVVYAEPKSYKKKSAPSESLIFDLSEKISELRPIPQFTFLRSSLEREGVTVPTLGFEGQRFAYMVNEIEPMKGELIPIVGLPGFRPEFVYNALIGNERVLKETGAWEDIQYAQANCPFDLFYTLKRISQEYEGRRLILPLIGTKPHSLGAIMFAILYPKLAHIYYDYPIRKPARSEGTATILEYDFSFLLPNT